jgi:hypothetical protein
MGKILFLLMLAGAAVGELTPSTPPLLIDASQTEAAR